MKLLLPSLLLLMVSAGCSGSSTLEVTSAVSLAWVKGSPDEPYVSAADDEEADQVLVVKARHVDSGQSMDSEVRIREDRSKEWAAFPVLDGSAPEKHIYFPDSVGVVLSLSYSVEKDGDESVDDSARILIPFGENREGREGGFEYEANWRKS